MSAPSLTILDLIDAIEQLTPGQRRQLQRRLYASGIFVPDVLLTDQNRLATAPALGDTFLQQRERRSRKVKPQNPASFVSSTPDRPNPPPPRTTPVDPNAPYHSPISGTIVLGTPAAQTQESDSHLMPPLPGQAPEQPIGIFVEAGSFVLRWPGEAPHRVRLNFRTAVGTQEAHFDTLIHLLGIVERRLRESQADPQGARLDIRSDNEEFLRQARGEVPVQEAILQIRLKKLQTQLRRFGNWRFVR